MRISIKKRIDKMVGNLQEEFNTHAAVVLYQFNLDTRVLRIIVDYPLDTKDFNYITIIPKKHLKDFFEFMEAEIKNHIYTYINLVSERYGYVH